MEPFYAPSIICTLILVLVLYEGTHGDVLYRNEQELMDHLLQGYNKLWRPVSLFTNSLTVKLHSYVRRIEKLDEQNEILTTTLQIQMRWKDEKLRWNVSETASIYYLEVPPHILWLPHCDIYNSIQTSDTRPLDLLKGNKVLLDYTGHLQVLVAAKVDTSCKVDLTKFPFDKQNCTMTLGLNTLSSYIKLERLYVASLSGIKDTGDYFGIRAEWQDVISNITIEEYDASEDYPGEVFNLAKVSISMRRNPLYYVIYLVVPSVLMAFVSVLVFLLPPESGERIGLSITVLLSYTVFSLMVSEVTPRGGSSISVLVGYITTMSCLSTLVLLLNVLILRAHGNKATSEVPGDNKHWKNIDLILFILLFGFVAIATVVMLGVIMS